MEVGTNGGHCVAKASKIVLHQLLLCGNFISFRAYLCKLAPFDVVLRLWCALDGRFVNKLLSLVICRFQVFKKFGLEKYDPADEEFDPNRHNAVFQVPSASKPVNHVAVVLKVFITRCIALYFTYLFSGYRGWNLDFFQIFVSKL